MFNVTLGKILSDHSINNWYRWSDTYKADVFILDPEKMGFDRNYYRSSINEKNLLMISKFIPVNFNKILQDCVNFVKRNITNIDRPLVLIYKLIRLKNHVTVTSYSNSPDGVKNLSELKHYGYQVNDVCVKWDKPIPLKYVVYKANVYCVDENETEKLGYGVIGFSVDTDNIDIRTVRCEGKHPNVHPITKSFCAGDEILRKPINVRFLDCIRVNLQYANLDSPYKLEEVKNDLLPLIKECS